MDEGTSRRALLGALAVAGAAGATSEAAAAAEPQIWRAEYTVRKGDVPLWVHRKRLGAPRVGEAPKPVLLLVHGSSLSSEPAYDLTVPGAGEYSTMNVFSRLGYDVWAFDHEGYGRSGRTSGNSDIASGVEDLKVVSELIERETGRQKMHVQGESSGALRAGAFAMARPERVDRLVLLSFTWTGHNAPTLIERRKNLAAYRASNRRKRDLAAIESIFTRDKPGTSNPAVPAAIAAVELKYGDTVPTGTYLDMSANLPVVNPEKVTCPVLIVRGQFDGIATEEDCLDFFRRLPNLDRQFVCIANASHSLDAGYGRNQLWHAIHSFLSVPPPLTS